jgi:hypothetical protein
MYRIILSEEKEPGSSGCVKEMHQLEYKMVVCSQSRTLFYCLYSAYGGL